jgi:hypothetical protein
MNLCYDGYSIYVIASLFFKKHRLIVELSFRIRPRKRRFYSAVVVPRKCGTHCCTRLTPRGYAGRGAVPRIENLKDGNNNCPWTILKRPQLLLIIILHRSPSPQYYHIRPILNPSQPTHTHSQTDI